MDAYKQNSYDHQYKILLIGDSGVGKTSVLYQFVDHKYFDNYVATIGIDYKIKNIELDGQLIRLQIWDTAGQERFRTITAAYFRKAMGIILVYDVTSDSSFNNVTKWLESITRNAPEDIKLILLGNKVDKTEERRISTERGKELADKHGILFMEVSAKANINIENAFVSLAKIIKNKESTDKKAETMNNDKSTENNNGTNTIKLNDASEKSKNKPPRQPLNCFQCN